MNRDSAHFLDVDDLSAHGLRRVLDRALRWKEDPGKVPDLLTGHAIAAVFEKPSARTRVSFEVAVATALRFEPSLLVTDDEIDEALTILGKALA